MMLTDMNIKQNKKVYLASSFAYTNKTLTELRKNNMQKAAKILTDRGFDVYNPSTLKIENAWDYSMWDWGSLVYEEDRKQIDECDFMVMLSYGKENNAGSAFEVGYATGINKKVILISMNPDQPESLMLIHSAHACLEGIESLELYDFVHFPMMRIERIES